MYLRELSRSKFHSVTSSNVILYNDAKNSIFIKSGYLTRFGNELFNYSTTFEDCSIVCSFACFFVAVYWYPFPNSYLYVLL